MRNILIGTLLSFLVACGGNKACEELKSKVCDGDADCVKAFDADMKDSPKDEKISESDKNAICKMMLDDKEGVEMLKKQMKRKSDKANKKEDKKEEKKDEEKKGE